MSAERWAAYTVSDAVGEATDRDRARPNCYQIRSGDLALYFARKVRLDTSARQEYKYQYGD